MKIFLKREMKEEPTIALTFQHLKGDFYKCRVMFGERVLICMYLHSADIDKVRSYYEGLFQWNDKDAYNDLMAGEPEYTEEV